MKEKPEITLDEWDLDTSDRDHIVKVLSYVGVFILGFGLGIWLV